MYIDLLEKKGWTWYSIKNEKLWLSKINFNWRGNKSGIDNELESTDFKQSVSFTKSLYARNTEGC